MSLSNHLEESCESIDASVFSSDVLYDEEVLNKFEEYVERWRRGIKERRAGIAEERNGVTPAATVTSGVAFLQELRDLCHRAGDVSFIYTNDDDGIHICLDGDEVFVGFLNNQACGEIDAYIRKSASKERGPIAASVLAFFELTPENMSISTYSSRIGGFSQNDDIGVRVTHLPSRLYAGSDSERSQHLNKSKAISLLKDILQATVQSGNLPIPRIEVFQYLGYNGGFASKRVLLWKCDIINVVGEREGGAEGMSSGGGYLKHEYAASDSKDWQKRTGWPVFDLERQPLRDEPLRD